ncbi:MAG: hypothetical protein IT223_02130, partial [Crocinitomicaceae bacterium]|nr:hypothetical protein [Crocinitomicaceae bacterium]
MASTTLSSISDIQTDYHGRVLEILSGNLPETLLFNYFGDFNQVKVDYLLHIVETSIIEAGDKRQTMKRICSVLI